MPRTVPYSAFLFLVDVSTANGQRHHVVPRAVKVWKYGHVSVITPLENMEEIVANTGAGSRDSDTVKWNLVQVRSTSNGY